MALPTSGTLNLLDVSQELGCDRSLVACAVAKGFELPVELTDFYGATYGLGPAWVERQALISSDLESDDIFGRSVSISGDGQYAVIGAVNEDSVGSNSGAVYVFIRLGNTWTEQAKLLPSEPVVNGYFGFAVSISSDGNYIAVGAISEGGGSSEVGAVYVFNRVGAIWSEQVRLEASDKQTGAKFGSSVSLSGDGSYLIVGASGDPEASTEAGAAYIFKRSGSAWEEKDKHVGTYKSSFGSSVSMSEDGLFALVGSPRGGSVGSTCRAYALSRAGENWDKVQLPDHSGKDYWDGFGTSVSVSSDGSFAVIGANKTDDGAFDMVGATYLFERNGSVWAEVAKFVPANALKVNRAYFGGSVSISGNGELVAIGAIGVFLAAGGTKAGEVILYAKKEGTWVPLSRVFSSDAATDNNFGNAVALSSDGLCLISGALFGDTGLVNSGSAYIFTPPDPV